MKDRIIYSVICILLLQSFIVISGCGGGSSTNSGTVPIVVTATPIIQLTATPTIATITYGNISGQILNNTGTGYSNAFVVFQSLVVSEKLESSGLYTRSTTADGNGYYSFTNVPQGACGIYFWATQSDYQTNQNNPLGSLISTVTDDTNNVILQQGQVALTPTPTATTTQPGTTPTATKTPLSVSTPTKTPNPGTITVYSSTTANHTHNITISASDLNNPPSSGKTYTSSTTNGHSHALTLTQAQLIDINNGNTVTVISSNNNGHTHTWTIIKNFSVTSGVTSSHTHSLTMSMADIGNPPVAGVTYTSSTTNGHTHNVYLTQSQLNSINTGNAVTVTSSIAEGHTHSFSIVSPNPAPTPTPPINVTVQ